MNSKQKLVQQQFLNNEEAVIARLQAVYARAYKDIEAKLKELTFKIGDLQQQYDWLDDDDPQKQIIKSQIQAKIYQKQYQEQLRKQVDGILSEMQTKQFLTISDYLDTCYTDGFIGTVFDMHGQGIPLIMPINQESMVTAVQLESQISEGLYTHLNEDVSRLKTNITAQVSRGIATGMTYSQVAQQIGMKMRGTYETAGGSLFYATRIARTEGHRIQTQAAMDACYNAKERGADIVKQWDAALDKRTRTSHQIVDGEIRELDEKFSNNLRFPGDPHGKAAEVIHCRCALLQRARWALDDGELETLKQRAEYYGLDKSNNFDDFKQKYLKAVEEQAQPITRKSTFTPATTIEEAEEYAKRFVDTHYQSKYSGQISYKGVGIDTANKINEVLSSVYGDYDIPMLNNLKPMNFREAKWKSAVENGIAGAYQWGNGGTLFVNQKLFASGKTISDFTKKAEGLLHQVLDGVDLLLSKSGIRPQQAAYLRALKKSGVQVFAQTQGVDFTEATFIHEAGHMLDDKLFRKLFKEHGIDLSESMAKFSESISGYATASGSEYIAESFTAFWYGKTDILDPDLVKVFRSAKRSGAATALTNSASGGIMSSARIFASGSSSFPTVKLPRKEYAHVMSEIATNITEEQRNKSVFRKAIGDYFYMVENGGNGEYRIIGKELIE